MVGDLEVLHAARHHHRSLHLPPSAGKTFLNNSQTSNAGNTLANGATTLPQSGNTNPSSNKMSPGNKCHLILTPPSVRRNNGNNNVIVNGHHMTSCAELARRSCLLTESSGSRVVKVRKTVVFADARGLALTQVRIMSEPSEVPPFWSHRFLSQLTAAATGLPTYNNRLHDYFSSSVDPTGKQTGSDRISDDDISNLNPPWIPAFAQPARDYVEFRRRLDETNVALENVAVIERDNSYGNIFVDQRRYHGEFVAVGSVKVRNLEYHKEVTLRYTVDGWKTHKDEICSHVPNSSQCKTTSNTGGGAFVIHDTFRFELPLPSTRGASVLEFCVRFRCAGVEYWDNNRGSNYALRRREINLPPPVGDNTNRAVGKSEEDNSPVPRVRDATAAKIGAWSEFASWEHLENSCPYW